MHRAHHRRYRLFVAFISLVTRQESKIPDFQMVDQSYSTDRVLMFKIDQQDHEGSRDSVNMNG